MPAPAFIVQCIFYSLTSSLLIIALFITFYQYLSALCKRNLSDKFNATLRVGSIAGFSLTQLSFTTMLILGFYYDFTVDFNVTIECSANTIWLCSEFLLLVYFINRFYSAFSFQEVKYQLSNTTYNLFYCAAFTYLVLQLCTIVNLIVLTAVTRYSFKNANWVGLWLNIVSVGVDTSLNCAILYLYSQNLLDLISDVKSARFYTQNNLFDQRQTKLLDTVTKYFILLGLSIIVSFILFILAIASSIYTIASNEGVYFSYPSNEYTRLDIGINYLWQIDCLSNAYALFFEREYTRKYYGWICKNALKLHPKVKSLFVNESHKRCTMNRDQLDLPLSIQRDE